MNDKLRQLGTLFQLREKERDEKRVAFAKVAEEVRALESFLGKLESAILDAKNEIVNARKNTSADISNRQRFNAFRAAKEAEISDYETQQSDVRLAIKNAKQLLEEKRKELISAEAALKAVDKTLEKENLQIKKTRAKKDEDEADEIAQSRWGKQ